MAEKHRLAIASKQYLAEQMKSQQEEHHASIELSLPKGLRTSSCNWSARPRFAVARICRNHWRTKWPSMHASRARASTLRLTAVRPRRGS